MAWRGLVWGVLTGALIGFCLGVPVFVIGGLIGFIWGGGVGARVGLTTAAATSVITLRWYYPLKCEQNNNYALMMGWVCPGAAGLSAFVWTNWTYGAGGGFYLAVLPSILAAVCAVPLSRWLTRWYSFRQKAVQA